MADWASQPFADLGGTVQKPRFPSYERSGRLSQITNSEQIERVANQFIARRVPATFLCTRSGWSLLYWRRAVGQAAFLHQARLSKATLQRDRIYGRVRFHPLRCLIT
jgi:hypothetical protein